MSQFGAASAGGDRRVRNVFSKLNESDKDSINQVGLDFGGQQDLQYPSDLGDDEYNQFILFSMYDHQSDAIQELDQQIINIENELDVERARYIEEATQSVMELVSDDGPSPYGPSFFSSLVSTAFSTGLAVADAPNAIAKYLSIIDQDTDISLSQYVIDKYPHLNQREQEFRQKRTNQLALENAVTPLTVEARVTNFEETTARDSISAAKKLGLEVQSRRGRPNTSRLRLNPATKKKTRDIALYIPNKLVNNGTLNYNSVEMGGFRAAKDIITKLDMSALFPFAKRKTAELADSLTSFAGINLNSEAAIQQLTGLAVNPRIEQLFDGVSVRSFDYVFSLAPRTQEESIVISNIIRTFRAHSHPRIGAGGHFLNVPSEFEIRYYKVNDQGVALENLFLNKIGRCSLTNVNVDYTPNNINATFENGSPVRTNMTLTFTELRPLTKEDIEEGF